MAPKHSKYLPVVFVALLALNLYLFGLYLALGISALLVIRGFAEVVTRTSTTSGKLGPSKTVYGMKAVLNGLLWLSVGIPVFAFCAHKVFFT